MRIGIDISFWDPPNIRGIGNMTKNLVSNLELKDDTEIYLFSNKHHKEIEIFCSDKNFKYLKIGLPFPIYEQVALPIISRFLSIDLFHFLGNTGSVLLKPAPVSLITVCDTIFWEKSFLDWILLKRFGNAYRSIIAKLQILKNYNYIFISHYTRSCFFEKKIRSDILEKVIYLSGELPSEFKCRNFEITQPYFLCAMGAEDPRKNTSSLIKAFISASHFQELKVGLKIFGFQDIKAFLQSENLDLEVLSRFNITLFPFLTEEEKYSLIGSSIGFIYLSTSEGFGIPILEAQALGKRCLVSSTSSCKEIAGPYSITVDPINNTEIEDGIVKLINRCLEDKNNVDQKNKIKQYAEKYSWKKMANETLSFYFKVKQWGAS